MKAWETILQGQHCYNQIKQRHSQYKNLMFNSNNSNEQESQDNQFLSISSQECKQKNKNKKVEDKIRQNFHSFTQSISDNRQQSSKNYEESFGRDQRDSIGSKLFDNSSCQQKQSLYKDSHLNCDNERNKNQRIVVEIGNQNVQINLKKGNFEDIVVQIEKQTGRKFKQSGIEKILRLIKQQIQIKTNSQTPKFETEVPENYPLKPVSTAGNSNVSININMKKKAENENEKQINKENSFKIGCANYSGIHELNRVIKSKNTKLGINDKIEHNRPGQGKAKNVKNTK